MGIPVVGTVMKKVFGTRNERMVKRYLRVVDQVSSFEDDVRKLTDAELKAKTNEFRQRIADGEKAQDLIPEVFAIAREAMDRAVGIRNIFDPQLKFDPSVLPESAQALYEDVKKQIEQTPDEAPEGDFLGNDKPTPAWQIVDIPVELYDAVREVYPKSRPPFRARPFDVQIIGAVVLYEGRIAEMKTGEGKTIVAPLSTYLAVLEDQQVHVITVNEYLVKRDRDWTFPFFRALGLTVGANRSVHGGGPEEYERLSLLKKQAYDCDVVYGTTSEFGFDYLRDNMKISVAEQYQKKRHFAIVDEVDSTLIDEARTPLIISGPAHQHSPRYELADKLARDLLEKQTDWNKADQQVQSCMVKISGLEGDIRNARDKSNVPAMRQEMEEAQERLPQLEADRDQYTQYYEVELDKKKAQLTHEGIAEAQKVAGLGSFYVGDNIDIPHLLEQAIRAHSVFQRDRDYVVAPDEEGKQGVIIVDQNTGRKMVGRQWSDGLHQAVEAKEGVPIKQETQTMATITIQNFYKLYDKLAGMTGTADTEATEFYEIYKLDVIVIPTNEPMIRDDRDDLVFLSERDKWDAIVDEIKTCHDVGQPVLVGTTSVESSEQLSQMLTKKYNIKHEVLNAKQHEREADIITHAGELGAVMIATNMAGRGTDIVLGEFESNTLIDHWKRRGLCQKNVEASATDDEITASVYRHIAPRELGLNKQDVEKMSDEDIRLALLRSWCDRYVWGMAGKTDSLSESEALEMLDESGSCHLHRLRKFSNVEDLGGLHVVGTERHESRRIDNQLRGRSGRQGDNGSSRFFLSLEDDLMKMFAGKTTLNVLSKLGMKEGDAIQHPMLSKAVGRAQRKVEERNFLIRKNILEYDEVMDHQRHEFYGTRQRVLEGRDIKEIIFEYIDDAVHDAVYRFLDPTYVSNCIAEWVRENLNVSIDADRIKGKDRDDLHKLLTIDSKEEAANMIRVILNEYMAEEIDQSEWDYKGLADWGNSNFQANLKISMLREMSQREIIQHLEDAAEKVIDSTDLTPLDQYLVQDYGAKELVRWAKNKFLVELEPKEFVIVEREEMEDATEKLMQHAREAYARREIYYPVDFALEMTSVAVQNDPNNQNAAIEQFCSWVNMKYELDWQPQALPSNNPMELRKLLIEEAESWDEARITDRAERALANGSDPEKIEEWMKTNLGMQLLDEDRERVKDDPKSFLEEKIAQMLRSELTQFERWVLLQIVDQAWKDHLYAVDQLRESIGLRSFSQRDPRIEFKREGARLFEEMYQSIRDKVTDLIYKGKLTPQARPAQDQARQMARSTSEPPPGGQAQPPAGPAARQTRPPAQPAQPSIAAAAAASGTETQRRDLEAAERAGSGSVRPKRKPIRAATTVGRNEPCPCGSGKKYKQCCGKRT